MAVFIFPLIALSRSEEEPQEEIQEEDVDHLEDLFGSEDLSDNNEISDVDGNTIEYDVNTGKYHELSCHNLSAEHNAELNFEVKLENTGGNSFNVAMEATLHFLCLFYKDGQQVVHSLNVSESPLEHVFNYVFDNKDSLLQGESDEIAKLLPALGTNFSMENGNLRKLVHWYKKKNMDRMVVVFGDKLGNSVTVEKVNHAFQLENLKCFGFTDQNCDNFAHQIEGEDKEKVIKFVKQNLEAICTLCKVLTPHEFLAKNNKPLLETVIDNSVILSKEEKSLAKDFIEDKVNKEVPSYFELMDDNQGSGCQFFIKKETKRFSLRNFKCKGLAQQKCKGKTLHFFVGGEKVVEERVKDFKGALNEGTGPPAYDGSTRVKRQVMENLKLICRGSSPVEFLEMKTAGKLEKFLAARWGSNLYNDRDVEGILELVKQGGRDEIWFLIPPKTLKA